MSEKFEFGNPKRRVENLDHDSVHQVRPLANRNTAPSPDLTIVEGGRSDDDPGKSEAPLKIVKKEKTSVTAETVKSLYNAFCVSVDLRLKEYSKTINSAQVDSKIDELRTAIGDYDQLTTLIASCFENDFRDVEQCIAVKNVVEKSLGIIE